MPLAAGEGDRRMIAEDVHANLRQRFALRRVDFAGHDRGARFVFRQVQFAEAGARA
jgi:hypothetical protein